MTCPILLQQKIIQTQSDHAEVKDVSDILFNSEDDNLKKYLYFITVGPGDHIEKLSGTDEERIRIYETITEDEKYDFVVVAREKNTTSDGYHYHVILKYAYQKSPKLVEKSILKKFSTSWFATILNSQNAIDVRYPKSYGRNLTSLEILTSYIHKEDKFPLIEGPKKAIISQVFVTKSISKFDFSTKKSKSKDNLKKAYELVRTFMLKENYELHMLKNSVVKTDTKEIIDKEEFETELAQYLDFQGVLFKDIDLVIPNLFTKKHHKYMYPTYEPDPRYIKFKDRYIDQVLKKSFLNTEIENLTINPVKVFQTDLPTTLPISLIRLLAFQASNKTILDELSILFYPIKHQRVQELRKEYSTPRPKDPFYNHEKIRDELEKTSDEITIPLLDILTNPIFVPYILQTNSILPQLKPEYHLSNNNCSRFDMSNYYKINDHIFHQCKFIKFQKLHNQIEENIQNFRLKMSIQFQPPISSNNKAHKSLLIEGPTETGKSATVRPYVDTFKTALGKWTANNTGFSYSLIANTQYLYADEFSFDTSDTANIKLLLSGDSFNAKQKNTNEAPEVKPKNVVINSNEEFRAIQFKNDPAEAHKRAIQRRLDVFTFIEGYRSLAIDVNIDFDTTVGIPAATLWYANIYNDEDGYYHERALPQIQILDQ